MGFLGAYVAQTQNSYTNYMTLYVYPSPTQDLKRLISHSGAHSRLSSPASFFSSAAHWELGQTRRIASQMWL